MIKTENFNFFDIHKPSEQIKTALYLLENVDLTFSEECILTDVIVNIVHPAEEDDYLDGEVNMYKPYSIFTCNLDVEPHQYREVVMKELHKEEMFNIINELK